LGGWTAAFITFGNSFGNFVVSKADPLRIRLVEAVSRLLEPVSSLFSVLKIQTQADAKDLNQTGC